MKLRNNYPIIYIIICIMVLLSSCIENISMDLGNTYARLVVDGAITTDTTKHRIRLTKSGDALYQLPVQVISNAIVTISDGNSEFALLENSASKGVYETDPTVYGMSGKTYTLHISHVDINDDGVFEEYSARSYLKKENPIDSIQITFDDRDPDFGGWVINLYGKEIGGGRNFYLMKAYKNNVLLTDSTSEYNNISDNTGFNGGYFNGYPVYTLQKKKLDERVQKGDTITLEMNGINQEYFKFITDFIQEYNPKIPIFSGPSANISTNIEPMDKAVGFFAAYSITRCTRIY